MREAWIDSLKGLCISLVVLGHFTCPPFVFSFHLPLFFSMSGYLAMRSTKPKNWSQRAYRLLTPYFMWWLISLPIELGTRFVSIQDELMRLFYIKGETIWNEPLWFFPAFFFVDRIAQAFMKDKKFITVMGGFLFATVGFYLAFRLSNYSMWFGINKVFLGLFFYLLGALLVFWNKRGGLAVAVLLIISRIFFHFKTGAFSYYSWFFHSYRYFMLSAVCLVIGLFQLFQVKQIQFSFLSLLGRNTVFIMTSHFFIAYLWYAACRSALTNCDWITKNSLAVGITILLLAGYVHFLFKHEKDLTVLN